MAAASDVFDVFYATINVAGAVFIVSMD